VHFGDYAWITGKPEVIPGPKSGCGKLENRLVLAEDSERLTAYWESIALLCKTRYSEIGCPRFKILRFCPCFDYEPACLESGVYAWVANTFSAPLPDAPL
jgi:hypothetical protein